jgi:hypothetical protein
LGAGQYYLMTIKDKQCRALDGGSAYRLTVRQTVLVGDSLRPGNACPHPQPVAVQPLLAKSGPAKERRWFGGHLLRTQGAGG